MSSCLDSVNKQLNLSCHNVWTLDILLAKCYDNRIFHCKRSSNTRPLFWPPHTPTLLFRTSFDYELRFHPCWSGGAAEAVNLMNYTTT